MAELSLGERLAPRIESADVPLMERLQQRQQLREQGVHTPSIQEMDASQRESFIATQVGQSTLGEPGFPDLLGRADIGLSDTFPEKKTKFLDRYPDGDFVQVNEPPSERGRMMPSTRGGNTILFRRSQDEPFAEFDAGALDKFELLGDIADMSGDVPAIVMEALVTKGAGLAKQMLQIGAGNVGGDVLKEILEEARGYQQETFSEEISRIGGRALTSMAGGAATTAVTGPINAFRGAAAIKTLKGSEKAQLAARELGIPPLLPSQIAASPIIQRIGRQSQATVSTMNDYVRNQQKATVQAISHLRDREALHFMAGDFQMLHDQAVEQIVKGAQATKTSLTDGGTAIQQGLVEYENLSRAIVNEGYARARAIEEPEFDLSGALAVAKEVKVGKVGAKRGGGTVALQPPTEAIRTEIGRLEALDPSLPAITVNGETISGTDQIRAIRSNLFELMQTGAVGTLTAEERRTAGQARTLFFALDRVLKNPANASEEFVGAWAAANGEASKRFSTLEKLIVVQASRSETPAQLADRLAKPLQVDNLVTLKDTVPKEQWGVFENAVKSDMISSRNLPGLTKRLANFDQETLDALLPKQAQADLRDVGRQFDRLQQANIAEVLKKQTDVAAAVRDLTDRNDTAGLSELISRSKNLDPDAPQRKMLRAGVLENVFQSSIVRHENQIELDGKVFAREIRRIRDGGLDALLTPDDMRVLGKVDELVDFLASSADSGTSLQAGSAAAGLRGLSKEAIFTLLENMGTARLMTDPIAQRILLGTGREKLGFAKVRVLGAILALEASSLEGTSTPQE